MTDTVRAVLDRIEGDRAVLLLEESGDIVDELVVAEARLPADGRHDGAVFDVRVEDGDLVEASYRPQATEERRRSVQERFDRLADSLGDEEDP